MREIVSHTYKLAAVFNGSSRIIFVWVSLKSQD